MFRRIGRVLSEIGRRTKNFFCDGHWEKSTTVVDWYWEFPLPPFCAVDWAEGWHFDSLTFFFVLPHVRFKPFRPVTTFISLSWVDNN